MHLLYGANKLLLMRSISLFDIIHHIEHLIDIKTFFVHCLEKFPDSIIHVLIYLFELVSPLNEFISMILWLSHWVYYTRLFSGRNGWLYLIIHHDAGLSTFYLLRFLLSCLIFWLGWGSIILLVLLLDHLITFCVVLVEALNYSIFKSCIIVWLLVLRVKFHLANKLFCNHFCCIFFEIVHKVNLFI